MPASYSEPSLAGTSPSVERAIDWVRQARTRPGRAVGIILAVTLLIGIADYLTNVSVSLVLFYGIPVSLAVIWGNRWWAILTSLFCIFVRTYGDIIGGGYFFSTQTVVWNRITNFANYLVIIYAVEAVASIHKRLEEKVALRTKELQDAIRDRDELQSQIVEVSRRERARIGHELHDELCQQLAAANIAMDLLNRELRKTTHPGEEIATAVQGILRRSIAQTKEIAYNLLSSEVKPEKLIASLHEMSERLGRKSGHAITFKHEVDKLATDTETASQLFYIAQEATLNAVKHSRAERINIRLSKSERELRLEVSDNGVGLEATSSTEHSMGFRIMNHRASLIGGRLEVESGPNAGTTIACCVALG